MLKPYNKQAIIRAMNRPVRIGAEKVVTANIQKPPSILDFQKWPQWWEAGARELEKTAPGRILTAPVRLPDTILTSTSKTVEKVPAVVGSLKIVVPVLVVAGVVGGVIYLNSKTKFLERLAPVSKSEIGGCH